MEKTSNAAAEEQERRGKEAQEQQQQQLECVWVEGPIIVGAGPSGLATAACLKREGVAFEMLERADCVASLWQHRTYDRLRLHLPKYFCELPFMEFPRHFPTYPTKQQFVEYVEAYVRAFKLRPRFNECVCSASFDGALGMWRVRAANAKTGAHTEFLSRWLVVATGENAEPVEPRFAGREAFQGSVRHVCHYKSGAEYRGKRVLVVGCGNSGMEVCLDLINHNASPAVVVRSSVHVLPREIAGVPTFRIAMALMKRLPVKLVDRLLLLLARFIVGDTARYGLPRPSTGPMQLKGEAGKTPVLDIGALHHIKRGHIKVLPGVERLTSRGAKFEDGRELEFDSVILATGYRSNVPLWLKDCGDLFTDKGVPSRPFPNGWKGKKGLYTVGFTKRGLLGASVDAQHIAQDIAAQFRLHKMQLVLCRLS